jgi:hypothetical protein
VFHGTNTCRYGRRTRPNARQSWAVGDTVNVGFVKGLEVVQKILTPGDYAPDAYALWQPSTGRFYHFVPHCGLTRCADLDEALQA